MRRACIVGLDGVGIANARAFTSKAALPNLSYILSLKTTVSYKSIPPYTPVIWTSIFTGVNPGKHGIFGFHKARRINGGFRVKVASSWDVGYPRIFEVLAINNLKSIVINIPLTNPPDGLVGLKNTIVVSDWSSPKQYIYPREYEARFREYLVKPPHEWSSGLSGREYAGIVKEYLRNRLDLYLELLEEENYSLYAIVFSEIDWIMHKIPEVVVGGGMNHAYPILKMIDDFIGRARRICDLVVIASDHGFRVVEKLVGVNKILLNKGYLKIKSTGGRARVSVKLIELVKRIAPKTILDRMRGRVRVCSGYSIDYESSSAFMIEACSWSIYTLDEVASEVASLLAGIEGVDRVLWCRDLFWGRYVRYSPTILLVPHEKYFFDASLNIKPLTERVVGEHDVNGMISIMGDDVVYEKPGSKRILYDIAPTITAYLRVPYQGDCDGEPLKKLFNIDLYSEKRAYEKKYVIGKRARVIRI